VIFWDRLTALKDRQDKMGLQTLYILLLFSRTAGNIAYPVQILQFTDLLALKSLSAFFEEQVPLYSLYNLGWNQIYDEIYG